ncbi:metallophosphoesterase [Methylobacterium sp. J-030]|uniref:metallophosphoesterase family protein n=1 Tax=Methylobacterium sp. J-030 TaxID=2836627 RepID=UPI001FBA2B76|nr:metallophosphoesterase [Methylobacterium sp. J-030]MCJ2070900.1 metallophosphoesterase [Methylobacterium sp. J-030]
MPYRRLLHISDTHFCEFPNRNNHLKLWQNPPALSLTNQGKRISRSFFPSSFDSNAAQALAAFVCDVAPDLSLIVHSGDLATTGRPDDLGAAFHFLSASNCNGSTADGKPSIGDHVEKLFICPGNHDRYKNNFAKPWSANFNLQFRKIWLTQRLDITYRYVNKDDRKICILAIDFCLRANRDAGAPYQLNRYGRGKVYSDTILRLNDLMTELVDNDKCLNFIWVIHFPPADGAGSAEQLLNFDDVASLAKKYNVSFVLSGHLHNASISKTSYGTTIIRAGTACAADEAPNCWIHLLDLKIEDDLIASIRKTDYKWDWRNGEFSPVGSSIQILS